MSKRLSTLEEKKAALLAKQQKELDQLNEQIKAAERRQKDKDRKTDTRRKILAGAFMLHHCETNAQSDLSRKLLSLLDEYLIKDIDRALFDLAPIPQDEQEKRATSQREQKRLSTANQATNEIPQ